MIETIVYEYLKRELAPTKVYFSIPNNPPDSFIVIEKTGSREKNLINTSVIAIQSYGKDRLQDAADLNERVKRVMKRAIELKQISACKKNTDGNFPDLKYNRQRYQAIYEITHY